MDEQSARPLRFSEHLCVLRGGGDLATGIAWRLTRAGFPVVVCELSHPLTVRRTVAMSTAVRESTVDVEGMVGRLASTVEDAAAIARTGDVGVVVAPLLPGLGQSVVIDARVAKRNIDTTIADAPMVIGLGPGFSAGHDCHAVIETARGHHLGRLLWSGSATADTGTPGMVAGKGTSRVLRAPAEGLVTWNVEIADMVDEADVLGQVEGQAIRAPFAGIVRGLILSDSNVGASQKIGDVDPRAERASCFEISDKSLAIGGGALEAVMTWLNRTS